MNISYHLFDTGNAIIGVYQVVEGLSAVLVYSSFIHHNLLVVGI